MAEKDNMTVVLSGLDVSTIVEIFGLNELMDLLIHRLELAIESYDPKIIDIPIRSGFNYNTENPGLIEWMPLYQKGEEVVIKVVGYHPKNPRNFNLPTILSSISSYDTSTGHLKGIADGVLLTALRTGAASAVASKYLAKSNSSVLGLIGCGAQSITQLHALSRIFDIKKVLLYDIDKAVLHSFSERAEILNLNLEIVESTINNIMENSDIVSTETSIDVVAGPLFNNLKTKNHLHINAVGSDFPGKTELPLDILKRSFVCPDFVEQAKIEGECQQLEDDQIGPDIIKLIQKSSSYEHIKKQLSVFDSTGWALEDQVVMDLFLDLANQFNIGLHIPIENITEDAKNPYHFLMKNVQV
jgi:L-lysine cyclodeaminase